MDKIHKSGLVKKTDTLRGFREMSCLTLKAFAGEIGMKPHVYEAYESGRFKAKFIHLKAALNIARIVHMKWDDDC